MLSLTLFYGALISLAWCLNDVQSKISVLHRWNHSVELLPWPGNASDRPRRHYSLCFFSGPQLSTSQTAYTFIANCWGRWKLAICSIRLQLAGQPLQKSPTISVLGLIHHSGTKTVWPSSGALYRSQILQSQLACSVMRAISQLCLVCSAEFQNLTRTQWGRLEAISGETVRAITGLLQLNMFSSPRVLSEEGAARPERREWTSLPREKSALHGGSTPQLPHDAYAMAWAHRQWTILVAQFAVSTWDVKLANWTLWFYAGTNSLCCLAHATSSTAASLSPSPVCTVK